MTTTPNDILFKLEEKMFELIYSLEYYKRFKQYKPFKEKYKQSLAALEVLNSDYKKLTNSIYIPERRMLEYHSVKWEF